MILAKLRRTESLGIAGSRLLDQDTFYPCFLKDLRRCHKEVIIECPFVTMRRVHYLLPALRGLTKRRVCVVVNTKPPYEHSGVLRRQAELAVVAMQEAGVRVLFTGGRHRKLVILDKELIYEGSLNILSQADSCEIMRRIESRALASELVDFLKLPHPF